MINRAAIILRYKEPAIKWINEADSDDNSSIVSLKDVNDDRTIYLIKDEDADTPMLVKRWIKLNFRMLFENELWGWYTDEALWPPKLTYKLFNEWFEFECYTCIEDTVGTSIVDEG